MKPYTVIANAKDLSRVEWLKIRKNYIGGSDAAAVCGLNPYASPFKVWMDKTSSTLDLTDNYAMKIGRKLEETVADLFEEEAKKKVRRNNQVLVSEKWPWMMANIDREVIGEDAILECKTTKGWNRDQWKDGSVPLAYQIQCHHYMAVTGADFCYIACMIGLEDFVWQRIDRDQETIDLLVETEKSFYDLLQSGKFPGPDGSDSYTKELNKRFKSTNESLPPVDIDPEQVDFKILEMVEEQLKRLTDTKERIEQEIKLQMGEATCAVAPGYFITWKPVTSSRFDTKSFKKDHPDIYQSYTAEKQARRFMIKRREKEIEEA